jgi:hypothetical protein
MRRKMDLIEANVLNGRANAVDAKHYALHELDNLSTKYEHAWNAFDVYF